VTRWFGGIKLGAGGLVRAYGGAAAECLRGAPLRELQRRVRVELRIGLAEVGALHGLLERHGAIRLEERYEVEGAVLRLELAEDAFEAFREALAGASRGRASLGPTVPVGDAGPAGGR